MITAKEARERIENVGGEKEKKIVEEVINRAIENGRERCMIGVSISDDTKKWLESLGYEVTRISDPREDQNDTLVSW